MIWEYRLFALPPLFIKANVAPMSRPAITSILFAMSYYRRAVSENAASVLWLIYRAMYDCHNFSARALDYYVLERHRRDDFLASRLPRFLPCSAICPLQPHMHKSHDYRRRPAEKDKYRRYRKKCSRDEVMIAGRHLIHRLYDGRQNMRWVTRYRHFPWLCTEQGGL